MGEICKPGTKKMIFENCKRHLKSYVAFYVIKPKNSKLKN